MAITAKTFELEHFDKLARGIAVAREAFAQLESDLADERDARSDAEERIADLEQEDRPSSEQWERLIEFIEDVGRGVYTVEELLSFAREGGR